MKKFINLITSLVMISMLIPTFSIIGSALDFIENGIYYSLLDNDSIYVYNIDETIANAKIPAYIQGKPVTEIHIEECNNLKTITIPNTVSNIIISKCVNITDCYIDDTNEYFTSVNGVIYSNDMKSILFYPPGKKETSFIVPDGIEIIGSEECSFWAFGYCTNLEEIILPDSLLEIKECAFAFCTFETIKLPYSLNTIRNCAFGGNLNLKHIIIPECTKNVDMPFYECNNLETVIFLDNQMKPNLTSSSEHTMGDTYYLQIFNGCHASPTVYVPDNNIIEYIDISDFWNLSDFTILPLSKIPCEILSGDVNFDQTLSISDIIMLQKGLANYNCVKMWKAGDMDGNENVNIFDLIIMKRKLINSLLL